MKTTEFTVVGRAGNLPPSSPGKNRGGVDNLLQDPAYQNIAPKDVAKMLGFFMEEELSKGFPWRPYIPASIGRDGQIHKRAQISDIEALRRIQNGKFIELQPMRMLNRQLSTKDLGGLTGINPASRAVQIATNASNVDIGINSGGKEKIYGDPVFLSSPAQLKLLYMLYHPDDLKPPADPLGKAAHALSRFALAGRGNSYGWTFHSPAKHWQGRLKEAGREFLRWGKFWGVAGASIGLLAGGGFGESLGIHIGGVLSGVLFGGLAGVLIAGIRGAVLPLKSRNGRPYGVIQVLDELLHGRPVSFQENKNESVTLPVFGAFRWDSEYGKPSTISSIEEMEEFSQMAVGKPGETAG